MSGGDVRTWPRCSKENPRELKTEEGIEWQAGLNTLLGATDRCPDENPGGEAAGAGQSGQLGWR